MIVLTAPCPHCQERSSLIVHAEDLNRWELGTSAQEVWPHWSAEQRELLITGMHAACWDEVFAGCES